MRLTFLILSTSCQHTQAPAADRPRLDTTCLKKPLRSVFKLDGIDFRDSTAKGPWPVLDATGCVAKWLFVLTNSWCLHERFPVTYWATVDCYQASGKAPCLLVTVETKEVRQSRFFGAAGPLLQKAFCLQGKRRCRCHPIYLRSMTKPLTTRWPRSIGTLSTEGRCTSM